MRIVHLTNVHPPGDTRIFHKECVSLARAGYDVVFVCAGATSGVVDGVRLVGVAPASGRLGRATVSAWRVLRSGVRERGDLYHYHDPELLWVALALRAMGRPVVFDAHEDVPKQIMSKEWIPRPLRRAVAAVTRWTLRLGTWPLSAAVVATPPLVGVVGTKRVIVLSNFPLLTELCAPEVTSGSVARDIVYAGGITAARGALEMVQAVQLVDAALSPHLVLAGNPSDQRLADALAAADTDSRVTWVGWLDRGGVRDLFASAAVGLCVLHPEPNYVEAYPVKLFEYMAAGVPVVASDFPLWRSIVQDADCGLLVDPLDIEAIAQTISVILSDPERGTALGASGRRAVEERYNWEREFPKLVDLYETILAGRSVR